MKNLFLLLLVACASTAPQAVAPSAAVEERHSDVPLYKAGSEMTAPKAIKRVEPIVPESLRKSISHASITIHLLIDQEGIVRDAWYVGGDPRLTKMTTEAALQWRFTPAMLNGKPIAVRAEETITVSVSHMTVVR
jgi:hypothetical protein